MTNYDLTDLPAGYDRARDHGPEMLDLWMRTIARHVEESSIRRVLDLGSGTGRFSQVLAARFDAEVIGLDPSSRMLQVAREKLRDPRVRYEAGRAEAIPLDAGSVDLIFISMALHHFTDPPLAARECRRVLSDHGSVVVRTGTREQIPSYPYVPFFVSSRRLLEETLPGSNDVLALFASAGLHRVASEIVMQTIAPDWMSYADKLAAGGDSILAQLSQREFEDGIASARRYAVTESRRPVVEPVDLFVFSAGAPFVAAR